MASVSIELPRILLRDFEDADREAFLAYQMEPRYLALYDFDSNDLQRAEDLFRHFRDWAEAVPRTNFQFGLFDRGDGSLLGTAGLRNADRNAAIFGMELAPWVWGRFGLALDAAVALIEFGFGDLNLGCIVGDTASGNTRVERLARWLGARPVAERAGPEWMRARGWREVDWALSRRDWEERRRSRRRHRAA